MAGVFGHASWTTSSSGYGFRLVRSSGPLLRPARTSPDQARAGFSETVANVTAYVAPSATRRRGLADDTVGLATRPRYRAPAGTLMGSAQFLLIRSTEPREHGALCGGRGDALGQRMLSVGDNETVTATYGGWSTYSNCCWLHPLSPWHRPLLPLRAARPGPAQSATSGPSGPAQYRHKRAGVFIWRLSTGLSIVASVTGRTVLCRGH